MTGSRVASLMTLDAELRAEKRALYDYTCDAIQTICERHNLTANITQEMLNAIHTAFVAKPHKG